MMPSFVNLISVLCIFINNRIMGNYKYLYPNTYNRIQYNTIVYNTIQSYTNMIFK